VEVAALGTRPSHRGTREPSSHGGESFEIEPEFGIPPLEKGVALHSLRFGSDPFVTKKQIAGGSTDLAVFQPV
jgi:hypothetical protein